MLPYSELKDRALEAVKYREYEELVRVLHEHAYDDAVMRNFPLLHVACSLDLTSAAKYLPEHGNFDVNSRTPSGYTPLMLASTLNSPELVDYLLSVPNIDLNIRSKTVIQETCLAMVCSIPAGMEIDLKILKSLLSHPKIDVNKASLTNEGAPVASPFQAAITTERFGFADLIINHIRFMTNNELKNGITDLHAVVLADYSDEQLRMQHVKTLIAKNANPLIRTVTKEFGLNAIELAKKKGLENIAVFLTQAAKTSKLSSFQLRLLNGKPRNSEKPADSKQETPKFPSLG